MQNFSCVKLLDLTATPNLGDLLGTTSSAKIIAQINSQGDRYQYYNSSSDMLQSYRENFIKKLVLPVQQAGIKIRESLEAVEQPREIYKLQKYDDLRTVHPAMYLPLLTSPPVYKLVKEGRIGAYGYTYDEVRQVKPVFDRLLEKNMKLDIYEDAPSYAGYFWMGADYETGDPDYSAEDIDDLIENREFVEDFLKKTPLDPTDLDVLRG